ncbi:MAG: RsiV family protein [Prevotella sp.]|nr:RsiV family protein [Prevotella sp.]
MKKSCLFVLTLVWLTLTCACSQQKGGNGDSADADSAVVATEHFDYVDSADYAFLTINIELPKAADEVTEKMRSYLLRLVGDRLSYAVSYEGRSAYPLYHGDSDDAATQLKYYFKETMLLLDTLSANDVIERKGYLEADSTLTPEQKSEALNDLPNWGYEYKLLKTADTLNYVVFLSQDYTYTGGAHGGMGGDGYITFDKTDGHVVRQFVDTTRVVAMQPLLIEGLKQYYNEAAEQAMTTDELFERLQLPFDGPQRQIPLPMWQPCPTSEGLLFCYGQYEIACYADGMPSFVVPYNKIKPFLTDDALRLLDDYLK